MTIISKERYIDIVNETLTMKNLIQFTCPQCGSHQLMLVERAMHRYVVRDLETNQLGEITASHKVMADDLHGDPLGFRCADCRYPDSNGNDPIERFKWQTLEDVQNDGAIIRPRLTDSVTHHCLICLPDGQMIPIIVIVSHSGPLTEEERHTILSREQIERGILISQSDSGIQSLAYYNWEHVKRHMI